MTYVTPTLSFIALLTTALASPLVAAANGELLSYYEVRDTTAKERLVKYTCQNNQRIAVMYGFTIDNRPTYAEARLHDASRFMPYNPSRSEPNLSVFGEVGASHGVISNNDLTIYNYHLTSMSIYHPNGTLIFKDCRVQSTTPISG